MAYHANPAGNFPNATLTILLLIKFFADQRDLGFGLGSYSLLLMLAPEISLLLFAPLGQVAPWFNASTFLIEKNFRTMLFGLLYFSIVWAFLLKLFRRSFSQWDAPALLAIGYYRKGTKHISTFLFSALAIVSAIVFRATMPGAAYADVKTALLPGNAWNALAVLSYFFVLLGRRSIFRTFTLLFVPLWFLLHYARVDILGLVVLWVAWQTMRQSSRQCRLQVPIVVGLAGVIFSYLGLIRNEGLVWDSSVLMRSTAAIVNYATVQDVLYSYASAIEYADHIARVPTLLWYFPRLVPFFGHLPDAAVLVGEVLKTNYGMLLPGEFYLNLGWLGFAIAPFVTFTIIGFASMLLKTLGKNLGGPLGYYLSAMMMARIMWYGLIYYLKPLIVIAPPLVVMWLIVQGAERCVYMRRYSHIQIIDIPGETNSTLRA